MKKNRDSKAIVDVLFDELEDLRAGKSTPQASRAVASLANSVCSVSRLEMDYARFVSDQRGDGDKKVSYALKSLSLGNA